MQRYSWYMAGAIKSSCASWRTKNYWSPVRWELDEVSLKKPNKRFTVSHEYRIQRSLEYLQNVWRVKYLFNKNFNTEPKIYNEDQTPLHPNESSLQKTVFHRSQHFCERKLHALQRTCDSLYAGAFRGALSFAAWICFMFCPFVWMLHLFLFYLEHASASK